MHMYKQAKGGKRKYYAERFKSQSAMEYLMTYGWAILIIAVILAAFFELGVFNPYTFASKAQPGSCQVYRPNGQGTNNFISLQGTCTNEIPEYAAQFNGQNSYIYTPVGSWLGTNHAFTVVAWYYSLTGGGQVVNICTSPTCGSWSTPFIGYNTNGSTYAWINGPPILWNSTSFGRWYFAVITYNAGSNYEILFINGKNVSSAIGTYSSSDVFDYATIGADPTGQHWGNVYLNGFISNVQIYNTALSQPDIQALYKEGIGGVPIDLNNLVGWWPLNGNANDYSGNGNNGNAINVSFTGGWYKGYTAP